MLLCTNSAGTDKLVPLVIRKHRSPWCFKSRHDLPCECHHIVKTWMVNKVFTMWILSWECQMKVEKQNFLLLIDNRLSHKNVPRSVRNVKSTLLPPSHTCFLRPMV